MPSLTELARRLRSLFRRDQLAADLDEEMRLHRDLRAQEIHRSSDYSPDEARFAAQRKFGNTMLLHDHARDAAGLSWLSDLTHDLRFAARQLRLSPGFAAVAILSLALGIGANTAIFQLLSAVFFRPLPVENPHELTLVNISNRRNATGSFAGRYPIFTYPTWEQIQKQQQAFSSITAFNPSTFDLSASGEQRFTENALFVSGDFFRVLGVRPHLGRLLTSDDDRRGCGSPGAVISHSFWQREYGGDPHIVGKKITLNSHPFEILGVTPAGFFGVEVGHSYDLAVPLCSDAILNSERNRLDSRQAWWLLPIGRLKSGWTVEQASAHLKSLSPGIMEATLHPGWSPESAKTFLSFQLGAIPGYRGVSGLRSRYQDPLNILLGITGLILLIACANLANLMLARAGSREGEIAVRTALGASRFRLIRQLFTESLLLAVLGAVLGAFLAHSLSSYLISLLSTPISPLFIDFARDWRVLAFTAALTALTCLFFGLIPALRATRFAPAQAMRGNSRSLTSTRERLSLRRILVVSQVALSLVLLVGALLFVRSFRNLATLDAGFDQRGLIDVHIDFARLNLPADRRLAYRREILERLRTLPGVASAAENTNTPVGGSNWNDHVYLESAGDSPKLLANFNRVSSAYFQTLATPILAGRDFSDRDTAASPAVALVNEAFARQILQGKNPVGARFRLEGDGGVLGPPFEIIGLVRDMKYDDLRQEFPPIVYLAASQDPRSPADTSILLRTSAPLSDVITGAKHVLPELSPALAFHFHILQKEISNSLLRERLMATLSGFFGILAALLAILGLYGVISYMVVRRTNEIGIRMALGAEGGHIARMILREAGFLLVIGLALGAALALASAHTARALLYGLEPRDPATLAAAIALLAAVALAAAYFPARRASRLDPMRTLREQ